MMQEILLYIIITVTLAGGIGYLILRYFYKGSILFYIGLFVILFGILLVNMTKIGQINEGLYDFFWAIPLAAIALISGFKFLNYKVKKPLDTIIKTFNHLQRGDITSTEKLKFDSNDEFGAFSSSANKLIDGFDHMATFAKEIGDGNLNATYELMSEDDTLGKALLEMKNSLINAHKEEIERKLKDDKNAWISNGHAKFGEILRDSISNDDIYYTIINQLVKYTKANQGGLFLINEDDEEDKFIELVAMYAYNRRKYIKKRIEYGNSLVGQCILEGETTFMTKIPKNYINITSGLGTATPSSLIIVPLKFNEKTFGVIELASFSIFDSYEIEFIEKISESIGSFISTFKINRQTKRLLEESKMQSEEMAAQEEEIRQNMEELQSTQEESSRRENEMTSVFNVLQSSTLYMEIDYDGTITNINENYAKIIGDSVINIQGKNWTEIAKLNENNLNITYIKDQLSAKSSYTKTCHINDNTNIVQTFSIIEDYNNNIEKILIIGIIQEL